MEIIFLIGAAEYRVPAEEARRLEDVIRSGCVDSHGHPLDENARACLQLADVIREDPQRGEHPKPIELGRSHVEGLCEYVIDEEEIASAALLTDLCSALSASARPGRERSCLTRGLRLGDDRWWTSV